MLFIMNAPGKSLSVVLIISVVLGSAGSSPYAAYASIQGGERRGSGDQQVQKAHAPAGAPGERREPDDLADLGDGVIAPPADIGVAGKDVPEPVLADTGGRVIAPTADLGIAAKDRPEPEFHDIGGGVIAPSADLGVVELDASLLEGDGANIGTKANALDAIYRESRSLKPDAGDILSLPALNVAIENLRRTAPNARYRYKAVAKIEKAVDANLTPYFENYATVGLLPELGDAKRLRAKDAAIGALGRLAVRSRSIDHKKAVLQAIVDSARESKDIGGAVRFFPGWIKTAENVARSSDDPGLRAFAFAVLTRDFHHDETMTVFHDALLEAAQRVDRAYDGPPVSVMESVEPLSLPARVKAAEPKGWFQDLRTRLPAGFVQHPIAALLSTGLTIAMAASLYSDSPFLASMLVVGSIFLTAKGLWTNHHVATFFQLAFFGTILNLGAIESALFGTPLFSIAAATLSFWVARLSYRWHQPGLGLALNFAIAGLWTVLMSDLAAQAIELLDLLEQQDPSIVVPDAPADRPLIKV